ncbi:MAG: phage portal protein [Clostridia bacterium]|nr:phage portal protein [Clostridia bacterium]
MANRFGAGVRAVMGHTPRIRNETVAAVTAATSYPTMHMDGGESGAMKLSAVNRCIEVLSDSIAKLPIYVMDKNTREHVPDHPLTQLLNDRPNACRPPSWRESSWSRTSCAAATAMSGSSETAAPCGLPS